VADRGLDQVLIYRYDRRKGTLTPNDPPLFNSTPGAGPRHLAFHSNGRILYELNEPGSTIGVLAYGAASEP